MAHFIHTLIAAGLHFTTSVMAQSPIDSLPATDTIGIHQQRVFFITDYYYSYRAATRLSGVQLTPLLRQPTDSVTTRLLSRARRRYILPFPLFLGSYGLIVGAIKANPVTNPEWAGALAVGSAAALLTGYVARLSAPGTMHRAVQRHNLLVTGNEAAYARPRPTGNELTLTAADTLGVKRRLLTSRYMYRGIQVAPELQLRAAMQSLNDPFITEGVRQNRVVRGVAGVVGALSASFLSTYYLTRVALQASGRRVGPTNPFVYYALTGLAVSFTLGRVADKTTRQVVERYNQHLLAEQ
ncbi:hypothetical protein [Fibrella arboris]|uniref:hypothetical protein n=1 Tax=Fibrella arboris TaxID=3242486 RepID=UPI0035206D21